MARYALIGGRSILNLFNPKIEEDIFNILGFDNPKVLYIPFAVDDMEKSYLKFLKLMENVKCNIKCVYNIDDIYEMMQWADVLYFGGGHSEDLINKMMDIDLSDVILSNKLLCGISAGAIMLSKSGMGDRYVYSNNYHLYNYKMVSGLNIVNITVCPHYDHDGLSVYNDEVKKYSCSGFGLEDDTAIIIDNNKVIPIKQDLSKSIYFFDKNDNYRLISIYKELEL